MIGIKKPETKTDFGVIVTCVIIIALAIAFFKYILPVPIFVLIWQHIKRYKKYEIKAPLPPLDMELIKKIFGVENE